MSLSRSHLDQLIRRWPRRSVSLAAGLSVFASLVVLAGAGCGGESALFPRNGAGGAALGGNGVVTGSGGMGEGGGGMGGQAGHVATGGMGSAGNGGGSGGIAGGGTGGQGAGGAGGQPPGNFGDRCQGNADCRQGTCQSGFCCTVKCSGTCQTCDSSGSACVSVANRQDPRGDCPDAGAASCGSSGQGCNGSGACILYAAGNKCGSSTTCSGTASVIKGSSCDGQGRCVANAPVSCNGFLCQSNACLTSCTDGTACVTGGFCGAGTCVGPAPNLAGNGDLEYATTDGWSSIPNGTGLSATTTVANAGMYCAQQASRSAYYVGPGYYIPPGLGKYHVSLWAMQNQVPGDFPPLGLLQIRLICAQGTQYFLGNIEERLPSGVWVNITGDIDTSQDTHVQSDCFPNGVVVGGVAGVVRSAAVIFDEDLNDPPLAGQTTFPNFYVDDLVVTVNDAHNLVGNPNFEAPGGLVDGWSTNGVSVVGTAMLSVSTTQHNGGKNSLWERNRSLWNVGIRYALPIGAANYAATFYVMQSGTVSHALQLWAAYSCLGDPANSVRQKAITQTTLLPTGTWAALSSAAVALPPSDAPKGCKLTGAAFWVTQAESGTCGPGTGQVECPDLFLDDATIALTNVPPMD